MQYISSRTQDLAHLMRWSKNHVLRTMELKEGDIGDELKDREREMCKQKPPLKNSEPAGAQSLTKPGGNPQMNTQNGYAGRYAPAGGASKYSYNLQCRADPRPQPNRDIQTTTRPWRRGGVTEARPPVGCTPPCSKTVSSFLCTQCCSLMFLHREIDGHISC